MPPNNMVGATRSMSIYRDDAINASHLRAETQQLAAQAPIDAAKQHSGSDKIDVDLSRSRNRSTSMIPTTHHSYHRY
jgi:hypothetical protein